MVKVLTTQKEPALRRAAAKALGEIGDSRAADPLLKTLSDEEVSVRFAAAGALAALGETRAVEPLVNLLYEEKEDRNRIIKALTKIDAGQAADRLVARLIFRHGPGETLELLQQVGPVAVESLITRLWSRSTRPATLIPKPDRSFWPGGSR